MKPEIIRKAEDAAWVLEDELTTDSWSPEALDEAQDDCQFLNDALLDYTLSETLPNEEDAARINNLFDKWCDSEFKFGHEEEGE